MARGFFDFFQKNRSSEFINNLKEEKKKYDWKLMVETVNKI